MQNEIEYRLEKIAENHYVIMQYDPPIYRYCGFRGVRHIKGNYETALAEFYAFNTRLRMFKNAIGISTGLAGITQIVFPKAQLYDGEFIDGKHSLKINHENKPQLV